MYNDEKEDLYFYEARVGQKVPDFELITFEPNGYKFGKFSLVENMKQKKWTILLFYPADFTFVCPTELKDFAEKYEEIKKLGGEFISVSTDTQFTHLAWHANDKMLSDVKYPMGADPTGNISRLFGVYEEESGLAYRGTFIINPEGVLVSSEINFNNVGRSSKEFMRKFKAFLYVNAHPNEACPAKWEEGSKTLKPSEKLVGKVFDELS